MHILRHVTDLQEFYSINGPFSSGTKMQMIIRQHAKEAVNGSGCLGI